MLPCWVLQLQWGWCESCPLEWFAVQASQDMPQSQWLCMWPTGQDNHVKAFNTTGCLKQINSLYGMSVVEITQAYSSGVRRRHVFCAFLCFFCTQVCPLESYQVHGDDLFISQWGFSSNHPRAFQILHTQPLILSYDVSDLVPAWQHIHSLTARRDYPIAFPPTVTLVVISWALNHTVMNTDITPACTIISSQSALICNKRDAPGFSLILHMLAMHRIQGWNLLIILRCKVEILETLQGNITMTA